MNQKEWVHGEWGGYIMIDEDGYNTKWERDSRVSYVETKVCTLECSLRPITTPIHM